MKCCRQKVSVRRDEMGLPQIFVCHLFNETLIDNLPISALLSVVQIHQYVQIYKQIKDK